MSMLVDAHCHLYEFPQRDIKSFAESFLIVAVSDDYESSVKTLKIASSSEHIIPCVGLHPWEIKKFKPALVEKLFNLAIERGIKCIGEVGLDRLFVPETFKIQLQYFKDIVSFASRQKLVLNVHAAGAWREVYKIVEENDVQKVIFHWYTGPLDLLKRIVDSGYYITINPAIKFQKKHRQVVRLTPLENMLTESDGPYRYRGLTLSPILVKRTIEKIAELKGTSEKDVQQTILKNFMSIFSI
ncbi:MAG: TatD family hydrolase [Thermoproteales archaeon]|nr:TatD family hydrolase [Thermoproteales archaeon]